MKKELIQDNYDLYNHLKGMNYNPPDNQSLEDFMLDVERKSISNLKLKSNLPDNNTDAYYFLTINMPPDSSFSALYDLYGEALLRYKWLRRSAAVFEYHTKEGCHPHLHSVVLTCKRRDTIIWLLSRFFKVDKNFIDCKKHYGNYTNHLNYIKGVKRDINKVSLMNQDSTLRDKYNIPHILNNLGEI